MENIFLTAFVWPTDNEGIIIWQIPRIYLDCLAYSEQEVGFSSLNRIGSLIEIGIRSNLEKLSCRQEIKNGTEYLPKVTAQMFIPLMIAQSAGAVEYTDCTSAEGKDPH